MKTRNKLPIGLILLLCFSLMPFSSSTAQTIIPPETKIPNFDCYRDAVSIISRMQLLAPPDSNLSELRTIGTSIEGAPIYALEIGNEAILDKPHFILLAGLHGNDFSQPELGLQFAETLLEGYDEDADLQWIVDNIEINLILLANPDGRLEAETQAKDFRDVLSIGNGNGVDLENNFCNPLLYIDGCDPNKYEPETLAILTYIDGKFNTLNSTLTPSESNAGLFVFFSAHDTDPNSPIQISLPINKIRIPWFYKSNPTELSEFTEIPLKWHFELAKMLKVLNKPPININGNIEPTISGVLKAKYPVDFVFRSYGVSSLELSTYPVYSDLPVDCSTFTNYHPENYLIALLKMAKSATKPYKIGYGPIINKLTVVETTEAEIYYHAEILDKNQIPNMPESNPITSVHYYIDQPTGTSSGELTGWEETNTNPYTSGLDFGIPIAGLTPGKHILTLQACSQDEFDNSKEVCGLPLSAFLIVPDPNNPDDPDPPDPPDDPDPPNPGEKKIYLPLIGR